MKPKVYLLECNNEGYITYKIGKTTRHIKNRIKELDTGSSGTLDVIYEYETDNASLLETALHRHFDYLHIKGEWYSSELNTQKFIDDCKIIDEAIKVVLASGSL